MTKKRDQSQDDLVWSWDWSPEPLGGPVMAKITQLRPVDPAHAAMSLLSLLAVICDRNGHTFSWYTSKKHRIWLTLKGFRPTTYSTSVEVVSTVTDEQMFDAIKVLFALHFPKLMLESPPLPTWIPARDIDAHIESANVLVNDLWQRWQAGEVFWQDTDGGPWQDARIMEDENRDQAEPE